MLALGRAGAGEAVGDFDAAMQWIEGQEARMQRRIRRWATINSGSSHRAGIEAMACQAVAALQELGAEVTRMPLPAFASVDDRGEPSSFETADAIVARVRPGAPRRVVLAIHLDTVFAADDPFQDLSELDENTLRGPGVADAKGGLAVMLAALAALERMPQKDQLGWTVVLNPDEEIGSPCSAPLLAETANEGDFGLVFEPCLPDGTLICKRKGSGNFTVVVRGRAAHVGREFDRGRSAIHALGRVIDQFAQLNDTIPGLIANTGFVSGGGAVNVVPAFALARLNLRVADRVQQEEAMERLEACLEAVRRSCEVEIALQGGFQSPPKEMDAAMERLMGEVEHAGREVGVAVGWQESGGVSDGNKLAAAGLANVDTMGPRGGEIHSDREYLRLDSLVPRAQLCAAILARAALGASPAIREASAPLAAGGDQP